MTYNGLLSIAEGSIIVLPNRKVLGVITSVNKDSITLIKPSGYGEFNISTVFKIEHSKDYICMDYSKDYIQFCLFEWGYKILTKEQYAKEVTLC